MNRLSLTWSESWSWMVSKPLMSCNWLRWSNMPLSSTPKKLNEHSTTVMSQNTTKTNAISWGNEKKQGADMKNRFGNNNSAPSNSKSNTNNNHHTNNKKIDRKPRNVHRACETCGKTNLFTERIWFEANSANRLSPRNRTPARHSQVQQTDNQIETNESVQAAAQPLNYKCNVFTPEMQLTDRRPPEQYFDQSHMLFGSNHRRLPWKHRT